MANCPKCKHHLRIADWRQKCPYCGANIVVYDLQERLMRDADKAEVQYYHFQKKIDRLKASFVGSKLAIVRIFTSILPVFALLLPFVNVTSAPPLADYSGNVGLITIYNMVDKFDVNAILTAVGDQVYGKSVICMITAAVSLVLSLAVMFVHFVCLMLACSPKAKIRNHILDALYLFFNVIAFACVIIMPQSSVLSISLQYGAFIYLALVLLYIGIDHKVLSQGISVVHKQCYVGGIPIEEYFEMCEAGASHDEIRAEMYSRLSLRQQDELERLEKEEAKRKEKEKEKEAAAHE